MDIFNYINKIPTDKMLHFFTGFFMGVFLITFFPILHSSITVCVIGIGKEVRDKVTGRGNCEVLDAICTITGGSIGIALIGVMFK